MQEVVINVAAGVLTATALALVAWLHQSYRRFCGIEDRLLELTCAVRELMARLDRHDERLKALEPKRN